MKTLPPINPKHEVKIIIRLLKSVQKKTRLDKIVIGLSGGLDSTTVLYLLKQAYSKKNIFVIYSPYMPSFFSFLDKDLKQVKNIIKKTKIPEKNFFVIPLKKPANRIIDQMKISCFTCPNTDYLNKVRVGNMMARLRMIYLFDIAKKISGLVCGTENKSERLLGYFTRFGDSASDVEPIAHLYKTQVIELAEYLKIPKEIINQKPTAGLWDGQTDEGEFGFTYTEADQVLNLYFDKKMSTEKIIKKGHRNAKKILAFVKKNQFKRQTPYITNSFPQKKAGQFLD